jgi:hypothetical protein
MDTKKCCKCDEILNVDKFHSNKKKKDGLQTFCKSCSKAYSKQRYSDKTPEYKLRNQKQRLFIKKWIYNYLTDKHCIDCGEKEICCLDFDRRDPNEKSFSMTEASQHKKSMAAVIAEISKCDIRCSNCHRKRTAKQFNWYCGFNEKCWT